jgi:hypothetical protein
MIVSPREREISRRSRALSLEISAIAAARVSIGRGYQVPASGRKPLERAAGPGIAKAAGDAQ